MFLSEKCFDCRDAHRQIWKATYVASRKNLIMWLGSVCFILMTGFGIFLDSLPSRTPPYIGGSAGVVAGIGIWALYWFLLSPGRPRMASVVLIDGQCHLSARRPTDQYFRSGIVTPQILLIGASLRDIYPIWIELQLVRDDCRPTLNSTVELESRVKGWQMAAQDPTGPFTITDPTGCGETIVPSESGRLLEIFHLIKNGKTLRGERQGFKQAARGLLALREYLQQTTPVAHGATMIEVRRVVDHIITPLELSAGLDQGIMGTEMTLMIWQNELDLKYLPKPKPETPELTTA